MATVKAATTTSMGTTSVTSTITAIISGGIAYP